MIGTRDGSRRCLGQARVPVCEASCGLAWSYDRHSTGGSPAIERSQWGHFVPPLLKSLHLVLFLCTQIASTAE
jgi:hypothetical protein